MDSKNNKETDARMKHWQQLSIEERLDVLEITSAKTHLPQLAVEKDWWVTMVLKALSATQHFELMSFKGGTSLSKGWNLINRFSEDIDIACVARVNSALRQRQAISWRKSDGLPVIISCENCRRN